jgi:hypothetical protein
MSSPFLSYASITLLALLAVLAIAGVRRAFRLTNLIGWYLLVFFLTYVLRPAVADWTQDFQLYDLLSIAPLDQQWFKMTSAVCLSLACLGAGYYFARNRRNERRIFDAPSPHTERANLFIAIGLILWGYLALLLSRGVEVTDMGNGYGGASGTTFWLLSSDIFVSVGSTLLYILNRRLVTSLLISLPWLLLRLGSGYARIAIIGHAMSLIAVWGMTSATVRESTVERVRQKIQLIVLLAGLVFVVLVIFPALGKNRGFFSKGVTSQTVNDALAVNQTADDVEHSLGDLAGFETTLYFLQLDQPVWGTYYLYMYFLKPIPRVIYPEKGFPDTLAQEWFGVVRDRNYDGQDAGCIGWAFQQWSWGGIVFEFLLTGWCLRKLEDLRDSRPHTTWILLAYSGFFSLLPQLGRDSLIVMIEERWLFAYGIPCALLWWFARTRENGVRTIGVPVYFVETVSTVPASSAIASRLASGNGTPAQ